MSLIYGADDQDRLVVCKIGNSWIASFRGGRTERTALELGTSLAFELPYSTKIDPDVLAAVLRRQNPGLLVIVERGKA